MDAPLPGAKEEHEKERLLLIAILLDSDTPPKADMKVLSLTLVAAIITNLIVSPALGSFGTDTHHREVASRERKGKRKALLIGIGEYQRNKIFGNLPYPLPDVARLSELLSSPRYGFEVHMLTDKTELKPTRKNILAAMRKHLIDDAEEGDTLFFYFSGHGSYMNNSLSDEVDRRDETIVPTDADRPETDISDFSKLSGEAVGEFFKDIRDKEIAEIFNLSLDKKVSLTAVFDSCHSGSIARSDTTVKSSSSIAVDIKQAPNGPNQIRKPEERGALIITAAEDGQTAGGGTYTLDSQKDSYSNLTAVMLQTLYNMPAETISAGMLFQQVRAKLIEAGVSQDPTIAATAERLERNIFGEELAGLAARLRAIATTVKENRESTDFLLAGLADGLRNGVEMRRINAATGEDTTPPLRIRVKDARLTRSTYEITAGTGPVTSGEVFEQASWPFGVGSGLKVWIPPALLSESEAEDALKEVALLKADKSLRVIDEPMDERPEALVAATSKNGRVSWSMTLADGKTIPLGNSLKKDAVTKALRDNQVSPSLFVNIPPSEAFRKILDEDIKQAIGRVSLAASRTEAIYELIGRELEGKVEHAWVLRSAFSPDLSPTKPSGTSGSIPHRVSLPQITDWLGSENPKSDAQMLRSFATRLGSMQNLFGLASPIQVGSARFPYRLEIEEIVEKEGGFEKIKLGPADSIRVGKKYDFTLKLEPASLGVTGGTPLSQFWVHLIYMAPDGETRSWQTKYGGTGQKFNSMKPSERLPLFAAPVGPFAPPVGTETFILLVTSQQLSNLSSVEFPGVRYLNQAERQKNSQEPASIESFLGGVGAKGGDTFLVQRIVLRSVIE